MIKERLKRRLPWIPIELAEIVAQYLIADKYSKDPHKIILHGAMLIWTPRMVLRIRSLDLAAEMGLFSLVCDLWKNGINGSTKAVDMAARNGYFDVVQFLYYRTKCTTNAIVGAAENGHYTVLQYLIDQEMASPVEIQNAFDMAAKNGHISCMTLLHSNNVRGTARAMECAAENGRLDVMNWMSFRGYPVTKRAIWYGRTYPHIQSWGATR